MVRKNPAASAKRFTFETDQVRGGGDNQCASRIHNLFLALETEGGRGARGHDNASRANKTFLRLARSQACDMEDSARTTPEGTSVIKRFTFGHRRPVILNTPAGPNPNASALVASGQGPSIVVYFDALLPQHEPE